MSSSNEPPPSTSQEAVNEEPITSTSLSLNDAGDGERSPELNKPYEKRRLYTSEVRNMWNLARIVRELGTREQCVAFAERQGLLAAYKECRVHRKPMKIIYVTGQHCGAFVCKKGTCSTRSRIVRSKGTWFENMKLSLPQVFYLMYCFARQWSYDTIRLEDPWKSEHCLSTSTILNWLNYCRETVVVYMLNKDQDVSKIGGPGKVVQIEESKLGKRKYNKGNHEEGQWLLVMIEDETEELHLDVCPENIHSAEVLVPLIKKHVAEGTTIHTNNSEAYDCLTEHGYAHEKVIKGDSENPENLGERIVEYLWRKDISRNKRDPFLELIKAIKSVYKIN